jgi:hypothetical protein
MIRSYQYVVPRNTIVPPATYENKYPIGVSFPSLRRFFVFLFSPIEVHGEERARSIRVAGLCLGFSAGSGQRWILDIVKEILGGFWRGKL